MRSNVEFMTASTFSDREERIDSTALSHQTSDRTRDFSGTERLTV